VVSNVGCIRTGLGPRVNRDRGNPGAFRLRLAVSQNIHKREGI
jgi:hypothetical protein